MLRDADCFRSRLNKLEGAGDLGEHLVNIVQTKSVAEQPTTASADSSNPNKDSSGQHEEQK